MCAAPSPAGSLVRLSLGAAGPAAAGSAVCLLAGALKGSLPGAEGGGALGPLLLVGMGGASALALALLHAVLYPRLVLCCAQLRQVSLLSPVRQG